MQLLRMNVSRNNFPMIFFRGKWKKEESYLMWCSISKLKLETFSNKIITNRYLKLNYNSFFAIATKKETFNLINLIKWVIKQEKHPKSRLFFIFIWLWTFPFLFFRWKHLSKKSSLTSFSALFHSMIYWFFSVIEMSF
jgi:hypothetical protein